MQGSALRHTVERLVLDTGFITVDVPKMVPTHVPIHLWNLRLFDYGATRLVLDTALCERSIHWSAVERIVLVSSSSAYLHLIFSSSSDSSPHLQLIFSLSSAHLQRIFSSSSHHPYVQIKYFEASWRGALVAHRIQPLHGSMHAHRKKASP